MPIAFTCPCGVTYTVDDRLAGKQAHCRKCERYLIIPNASGPAAEVERTLPPQPSSQPPPPQAGASEEEDVLVAEIVSEEPETPAEAPPVEDSSEQYAMPPDSPDEELPEGIGGFAELQAESLAPLPQASAPQTIETVVGVAESEPAAVDSAFYEIRSVSVWSLAILVAALGLVSGLIAALVAILAQAITGAAFTASLLLLPVAGAIGGLVQGAVGGIVYNLLSSLLGGITVYLSRKHIESER